MIILFKLYTERVVFKRKKTIIDIEGEIYYYHIETQKMDIITKLFMSLSCSEILPFQFLD